MKTLKRIICIFLVVLMMVTSVPVHGFAQLDWSFLTIGAAATDETDEKPTSVSESTESVADGNAEGDVLATNDANPASEVPVEENLEDEAKCGDSSKWLYDEATATLSIKGKGAIYDYADSSADWVEFADSVKSLDINEGITSIGKSAFAGLTALENVVLPASLTAIAENAFSGCTAIKKVKFSGYDYQLEKLTVADGNSTLFAGETECIETVGKGTMGESIKWSFYSNGLLDISGEGAIPCCIIYDEDGEPSEPSAPWLEFYEAIERINVGEGITALGEGAFIMFTNLKKVSLPSTLEVIGDWAFAGCELIREIDFPESLTTIGEYAFYACIELTQIIIPDSVASLGEYVFTGCTMLEKVKIGSNVTEIPTYAFAYCVALENVVIPEGITKIGQLSFYECQAIEEFKIPDAVTTIDFASFYGCKSLKNVELPGSLTELCTNAFAHCTALTSIIIPGTVKLIGKDAFSGCEALSEVVIGNGVENIEQGAFFGCKSIPSITIPATVKTIGIKAFENCSSLNKLTLSPGITKIDTYAFNNCSALTEIIYNGVQEQWDLMEIADGNTVLTDTEKTFKQDSANEEPENQTFTGTFAEGLVWTYSTDGHVLEISGNGEIPSYVSQKFIDINTRDISELEEAFSQLAISNGYFGSKIPVESLIANPAPWAEYEENIKSVIIGEGITSIGAYNFALCHMLTDISFPSTLKTIGDYCFFYSVYVSEVIYPEGLETIGECVLTNVLLGEKFYFPSTLQNEKIKISTKVDADVTIKCNAEIEMDFASFYGEEADEQYGENLFTVCMLMYYETLAKANIGIYTADYDDLEIINRALSYVIGEHAVVSEEMLFVLQLVFYYVFTADIRNGPSDGTIIRLPENSPAHKAARVCYARHFIDEGTQECICFTCEGNLTETITYSLDFETGVLSFDGSGDFPTEIKSEAEYPYYNAARFIKEIEFTSKSEIISIGAYAFMNYGLNNIEIPNSVASIGSYAFAGNGHTENLVFSKNVATVGDYAFNNSSIDTIRVENNSCSLGYRCFPEAAVLYGDYGSTLEAYASSYNCFFEPDGYTPEEYFTYTENEDGTLTVTGFATVTKYIKMPAYIDGKKVTAIGNSAFYYKTINTVELPEGVVTIGESAFYRCCIDQLVLPESLTYIDNYAFGSNDLTEIYLPQKLTWIGNGAFADCYIKEVVLPEGLTDFGAGAFRYNSELESLYLGADFTGDVFSDYYPLYVKKFTVSFDNPLYCSNQGAIYNKSMTELIRYPSKRKFSVYSMPYGVEKINAAAFAGASYLEDIELRSSLKEIGESAFSGCSSLEKLVLPEGITVIEDDTFYGCSSLESIVLPESLTKIGNYAFQNCKALKSIVIPNNVTSIGYSAFNGCEGLEDVTVGHGIKEFESYTFNACKSIKNFNIGNGLEDISKYQIPYVHNFYVSEGNAAYCSIDGVLFSKDKKTLVIYPSENERTEYTIPDGVEIIRYDAFENAKKLRTVTIPDTVTEIGGSAFSNCTGLIGITIPYSVTWISSNAFYGCTAMKDVTIGSFLENIYSSTFPYAENYYVSENNENYCSVDGVIFSKDKKQLVRYPNKNPRTDYTVPAGVTNIDGNAFDNSENLENLTFPGSLSEIGGSAFEKCNNLKKVYVGKVEDWLDISFSSNMANPLYYAQDLYVGDTLLTEVKVTSSSLEKISQYAFYAYENLTKVTVKGNLTQIGSEAFYKCINLSEVTLSGNKLPIGSGTFYGCTNLSKVTLDSSEMSIGYYAFYNCENLYSIALSGTMKCIDDYAFYNCKTLDGITISGGSMSIGYYAFYNCTSLRYITMPDDTYEIESNAFYNCTSLKNIAIPLKVTEIKYNTFYNCTSLENVRIPYGLKAIGYGAFYNCKNIVHLNLPANLNYISDNAFKDCSGIEIITISGHINQVGSSAFYNLSSLTDIYCYGDINTISSNNFVGNDNLTVHCYQDTNICSYAVENGFAVEDITDTVSPVISKFSISNIYHKHKANISALISDNAVISKVKVSYTPEGKSSVSLYEKDYTEPKNYDEIAVEFDFSSLEGGFCDITIAVVDAYGNETEESKSYYIDKVAPEAPSNVRATGTPEYIRITWAKSKVEKDFSHFNVYRSTSSGGTFSLVEEIYSIGYYDDSSTGIQRNRTYYYYVTSVDDVGNESKPTLIVSASMSADTIKPEIVDWIMDDTEKIYNTFDKQEIQVSLYDNLLLSYANLKYRPVSSEEWLLADETDVENNSEFVTFEWKTKDLEPGLYQMLVSATDSAGNISEEYIFELTVKGFVDIATPVLSFESLHKAVRLSVEYPGDKNAIEHYTLYRKSSATEEFEKIIQFAGGYHVDEVAYGEYIYKVVATDIFGNTSESAEIVAVSGSDDYDAPEIHSSLSNICVAVGREIAFDARKSKDNDEIVSYLWDFGDGYKSTKSYLEHSYKTDGNYTVTLTVTDASGNFSTETANISVVDLIKQPNKQFVNVKVYDSEGNGIEAASVIVTSDSTGEEYVFTTDKNGVAEFVLDKGLLYYLSALKENSEYNISQSVIDLTQAEETVLKNAAVPFMRMARYEDDIELYDTYVVEITLRSKAFTGKVSKPTLMSAQEIINAGIPITQDITLVKFEVEYTYYPIYNIPETLEFTCYSGGGRSWFERSSESGGGIGGSGVGCMSLSPVYETTVYEGPKYVLCVSGNASCMNQVFRIDLMMANSSEEDWMENCKATLNLMDGLKLVECDKVQDVIFDEDGGKTGCATWYVMGTKAGAYYLTVDVEGDIYPEPVEEYYQTFKTDGPLVVADLSTAMDVKIDPPEIVGVDVPEKVSVQFTNVSGITLNFVNLSAATQDDSQSRMIESFPPGHTETFSLTFYPHFDCDDKNIIGAYLAGSEIKVFERPLAQFGGGKVDSRSLKTSVELYEDYELENKVEELMCIAGSFFLIDEDGKPKEIPKGKLYLDVGVENRSVFGEKIDNITLNLSAPEGFSFNPEKIEKTISFEANSLEAQKGEKYKVPIYPIYSDSYEEEKDVKFTVYATPLLKGKTGNELTVKIKKYEKEGEIPFRATVGSSEYVIKDLALKGTHKIKWDSTQFIGKTSNYNHNTSKTLMAFSASVYREKDIKEALLNMGFSNVETNNFPKGNDQVIPAGKEDECSFAFATKKLIEDEVVTTLVVVLVRGTVENEWYGNINIGDGTEHYSFRHAADIVYKGFEKYYNDLKSEELLTENVRMGITGHSRGAAIANLLAGQNFNQKQIKDFSKENIYAYTFATPNASKKASSGDEYNNIFNIINPIDMVGIVPPSELGYKRYGKNMYLYELTSHGNIKDYENDVQTNFRKLTGRNYYGKFSKYANDITNDNLHMVQALQKAFKVINAKGCNFSSTINDILKSVGKVGDYNTLLSRGSEVKIDKSAVELLTIMYNSDESAKYIRKTANKYIKEKGYFAGFEDPRVWRDYLAAVLNIVNAFDIAIFEVFISGKFEKYSSVELEPKALDGMDGNGAQAAVEAIVSLAIFKKIYNDYYKADFGGKEFEDVPLSKLLKIAIDMMMKSEPIGDKPDILGNYSHCVETYISWLEVKKPFTFVETIGERFKSIGFKCPVDIEILNSKGDVVARITQNNVDYSIDNLIEVTVGDDDLKSFKLPAGDTYTARITGYDDGTMNYFIDEYDDGGNHIRTVYYNNVPITKGETITATIDDVVGTDAQNYNLTMPGLEILEYSEDKHFEKIVSSVASGSEVNENTQIELLFSDENAQIYYTLDGSSPVDRENVNRKLYTGAITLSEDSYIIACAVVDGQSDDEIEKSCIGFSYTYKCIHSSTKKLDPVESACEKTGNIECYICESCYAFFADEKAETELAGSEVFITETGHSYINACDKDCNACGEIRTVPGHKYTNACDTTCNICGATRAITHTYTNDCDKDCNVCKATRSISHSFKNVTTKATLSKNGKVESKCSVCGNIKSSTTVYYPKTIKLSATTYIYNGKAKAPTVIVNNSNGKTLKNNTDYTVKYASGRKKTGKYAVTITFKGNYSGTKTLYFNILPSKTSKLTPSCSTSSIKVKWSKVTGTSGYKVELLNSRGKVLKTATTKKTSYTFKKLSKVTIYKVRVTAYKTIDKKKVYSTTSTTITTSTSPAKATLSKVTVGSKTATPAWNTVSGASGYEVMYSTSKKFKSAKTVTVKKGSSKKMKIKKLTKGKKYYFKVRAYKTVDGKKVYGAWSSVKSVKVK